jgi:hypothetical protein
VSDRRAGERLGLSFAAWLDALATAGLAGISAVQLREKALDDRALWDLARFARKALPPAIPLLVNGRLDIAVGAGADGVHLSADGVPAAALNPAGLTDPPSPMLTAPVMIPLPARVAPDATTTAPVPVPEPVVFETFNVPLFTNVGPT